MHGATSRMPRRVLQLHCQAGGCLSRVQRMRQGGCRVGVVAIAVAVREGLVMNKGRRARDMASTNAVSRQERRCCSRSRQRDSRSPGWCGCGADATWQLLSAAGLGRAQAESGYRERCMGVAGDRPAIKDGTVGCRRNGGWRGGSAVGRSRNAWRSTTRRHPGYDSCCGLFFMGYG